MLPEGDRARILANRVIGGAYQNPDATVAIWDAVAHRLRKQAADTGIGSEFPDFASDIIGRATQAGYAGEDVAALIKVLRQR